MTLSLNEVEALAKKATRGAGYPWGLAEEAGKAVRWLHRSGLDGCAALAGLLKDCDGADLRGWAPMPAAQWTASAGILCPLATGAALSDRADWLVKNSPPLENVAHPILLAPFAAGCSKAIKKPVSLSWADCEVVADAGGLGISGAPMAARADVVVRTGKATANTHEKCTRADPAADVVAVLMAFAGRTYAPATEESRMKGAGSGLSDND